MALWNLQVLLDCWRQVWAATQGGLASGHQKSSGHLQLLLEGSLAATSWQQLWQGPAHGQSTPAAVAVESLHCVEAVESAGLVAALVARAEGP
jgi:hypothetical protein